MKMSLVSYNGVAINSADVKARIPLGSMGQTESQPVFASRSEIAPAYATKIIADATITIELEIVNGANYETTLSAMNALFYPGNMDEKVLVVADANAKQWYINATAIRVSDYRFSMLTVTLATSDPVWKSVSKTSVSWSITASGQTQVVTPAGNLDSYPILTLTPTVAGGHSFPYRRRALAPSPFTLAAKDFVLDVTGGGFNTSALISVAAVHVTINGAIDAVVTTINYDGMVGSFPSAGLAYVGTEQIYYTGMSGTQLTGVIRGVNGTTAAIHADNVVIYQSKIQANGNDVRLFVDGNEQDCWLSGVNTATTRVWGVIDFDFGWSQPMVSSISDSATTIAFTNTTTFRNTILKPLQYNAPKGLVLIDSEVIYYDAINLGNCTMTGCKRAQLETTAAAHSSGANVKRLEHEIWVYYGNPTAELRVTDDTKKPIIDLTTSTNSSWVFSEFRDNAGNRAGVWKPSLKTDNTTDLTNQSRFYTGERDTMIDPATEMGLANKNYMKSNKWYADNALISWYIFIPGGASAVTVTGEKYRSGAQFPTVTFNKSADNSTYSIVWTEASPAGAAAWTAMTAHTGVALGAGQYHFLFKMAGNVLGTTASAKAMAEIDTLTFTIGTTHSISFSAEMSCYTFDAKITNNTTGEWLSVYQGIKLGATMTVDTAAKNVSMEFNQPIGNIGFSTVRNAWLRLAPGANTLQFDDLSLAGVTLGISYEDRLAVAL